MDCIGASQTYRKHHSGHKTPRRIQPSKHDNPGRDPVPTNAEGVMKTTLFEVVDGDIGYKIILGRPWLHEMKVVPSIYHQLLKFPILEGIKRIKGDQLAAREMNAISVLVGKENSM
uniref:Uncharacterized protein n=1 Tax=Nicotiana tabacum TaxID=4097 RepID=A0A1S4BV70_TOBAC|nr:PREDICTED: uncharacterized protein LOC107812195 [Nicotiana tabacum]